MAYRGFRRVAVPQGAAVQTRPVKFPAPTRGWITNDNVAAAGPVGAAVLDNWVPTSSGARLRGGSQKIAQAVAPVRSMFTYRSATIERMFAATDTGIYNVFAGMVPAVTGRTSGVYSTVHFTTPGANYFVAVNGTDAPLLYDGATWQAVTPTSTPALTGPTGFDGTKLSYVWSYRNRLWFAQRGTLDAYYLTVDSLGGTAKRLALGSVFQRGGAILFGATISTDSGDGIDDRIVFVSTLGEVLIFSGSSPDDTANWTQVGRYEIGRPLGAAANMRAGGDLLIATEYGVVPLNQAVTLDVASLSLASITRNIEPEWVREVANRISSPWTLVKWPFAKLAIVGMPMDNEPSPYCFVVNMETGAWSRFTNWDVRCAALYGNNAYFATADNRIMQMEAGADDDGKAYNCDYLGLYDDAQAGSALKSVRMVRATFRAGVPVDAKLDVGIDYNTVFPQFSASPPAPVPGGSWDNALWDVALWDGGQARTISTRWSSVGRSGFAIAPSMRVGVFGGQKPDGELISIEYMVETGSVVV